MTPVSLVRVSELQALADSVKAGEVPLARLQKEVKAWVSEVEKHLRMAGLKKRSAYSSARLSTTFRRERRIALGFGAFRMLHERRVQKPKHPMPTVEEVFGNKVGEGKISINNVHFKLIREKLLIIGEAIERWGLNGRDPWM
ncbi:hypothetical protein BDFG_06850 [Blastomyces dermatitidis ATCC 26199]|nr:hypothetical protein BDFG_06850 [Blastomyces dermatitidis ATCC 26199]